MYLVTLVLSVLVVSGALLSFRAASYTALVLYGVVVAALYNAWFRAFSLAGPRTSRQVPLQRIAYCQQLSAQQLSAAYRAGTLRCVDVTRTYIEHISRVNPYINAMVFECFDEAIAAAERADAVWQAWRDDPTRPAPSWLLGVPCTVKECMQCIGCPNSSGHPARRGVISSVDSPVVHNFRDAGAIILGVTNTSELCMWYESSNYVYGITCNPYDTRRIVGGSSGGEGSAAGAAFATFSLGSDIGGSIRMPAYFNGVYGHKASPHYISNRGQHPGARTSANHYMATGVITRFPEDIIPLSHIAARGGFREDVNKFPPRAPFAQAFDLATLPRRLRVFVLEDFGLPFIHVSRSQIAALHPAAEALRARYDAEVVYINVRDASRCSGGVVPPAFRPFRDILSMWSFVLTSDPTETRFRALMTEESDRARGGVNWFAELLRWMCGRSEHTLPAISLCIIETLELALPAWATISRSNRLLPFKRGLEELLGNDGVLLTPTFPKPAPRHHYPLWNPMQFQYTAAFNVLQLPATACPVWQAELRRARKAPTPHEARAQGLPDDAHLPKGVQIVSSPLRDELCISVALALQELLGGYRYPGWVLLEGQDY